MIIDEATNSTILMKMILMVMVTIMMSNDDGNHA